MIQYVLMLCALVRVYVGFVCVCTSVQLFVVGLFCFVVCLFCFCFLLLFLGGGGGFVLCFERGVFKD